MVAFVSKSNKPLAIWIMNDISKLYIKSLNNNNKNNIIVKVTTAAAASVIILYYYNNTTHNTL